MATINKNFKIKNGLVVEGSTATVNGNDILVKNASDQYIIDLIGGETVILSVDSAQLQIDQNKQLSIKSNVFDAYGSASTAEQNAKDYADGLASNYDAAGSAASAQTAAQNYADGVAQTAENNAKSYADGLASNYDPAGSASTAQTNAENYADGVAQTAENNAKSYADGLASNYDAAGSAATAETNANNYTDNAVSGLVNGAPALLDTLKELADAIGNDPAISTTLGDAIGGKVAKAGDTMSGNLAMGGNKVTGLGTPTLNSDAATKQYVDDAESAAETYADGVAQTAENNAKSYADGLASNYDAAGSALTAENNAKSYADNLVADGDATATPTYQALDINSVAKAIAATANTLATTDTTIYSWSGSQYSAGKFVVKIAAGVHTQVIEVLTTLDTSGNVHVTEYAEVSTNGNMGSITVSATAGTVSLVANTTNNAVVKVFGTLLVA